jgi:hypothetical protein
MLLNMKLQTSLLSVHIGPLNHSCAVSRVGTTCQITIDLKAATSFQADCCCNSVHIISRYHSQLNIQASLTIWSNMAGHYTYLPMLAADTPIPMSFEHLKHTMDELSTSGQQRKLATDVFFLKQQAVLINSAAVHIQQACHDEQACRQLLAQAPQMLRQLVVITTAVLQQLAVQRDSEVEVSRAAGLLAASLNELLPVIRGRPADIHTPAAPAESANLRMMHDTGGCGGLLCIYTGTHLHVHSNAGPQHTY